MDKLAAEAPGIVAAIIVVIVFLKYLQRKDEANERREEKRDLMFKELNKENIDARNHSRDIIQKNTEAAVHAAEASNHNATVVKEMTKVMEKILQTNGKHFKAEHQ